MARDFDAIGHHAISGTKPGVRMHAWLIFALALLAAALIPGGAAAAGYASIVIDADTGTVLHSRNADQRNYPASLTKMMTLYMTFEAIEEGRLKLDQKLKVSRRAAGQAPSKIWLKEGSTITVEQAILALVTKSANDAATVLAESMAETEFKFSLAMTEKAKELGMSHTRFRNASGLPDNLQVTTARDMATLGLALIRDFPQYYGYFSRERFRYKGRSYGNHNNLLGRYEGVDGIKTGYIRASGYNLVSSALRDGHRIVGVVLGGQTAESRDRHMADLLDKGFRLLQDGYAVAEVASRTSGAAPRAPAPPRKPGEGIWVAVADAKARAENFVQTMREAVEEIWIAQGDADGGIAWTHSDFDQDKSYGIQVGAFSSRDSSLKMLERALSKAPDLLERGDGRTLRSGSGESQIFKAQFVGLSEASALEACGRLEQSGIDCLILSPK
jgi:D-alanyl-D-alanine carboxypeptidase